MQELKFLNKKEINKILKILKDQFGFDKKLDYVFAQSSKNKIYIVTKDIKKIDFEKIRVNNLGLYIAEIKDNKIRLSIEGSQLLGPDCNKNIIKLSDKQLEHWLQGVDVDHNESEQGFYILKHNKDFVGCTKLKNNKLLNYVPKNRRLRVLNN